MGQKLLHRRTREGRKEGCRPGPGAVFPAPRPHRGRAGPKGRSRGHAGALLQHELRPPPKFPERARTFVVVVSRSSALARQSGDSLRPGPRAGAAQGQESSSRFTGRAPSWTVRVQSRATIAYSHGLFQMCCGCLDSDCTVSDCFGSSKSSPHEDSSYPSADNSVGRKQSRPGNRRFCSYQAFARPRTFCLQKGSLK